MPDRSRKPDLNQLAKSIVDAATGEGPRPEPPGAERSSDEPKPEKNPAAVALGRLGGKKGGLARKAALSDERRAEIARRAARSRWGKPRG